MADADELILIPAGVASGSDMLGSFYSIWSQFHAPHNAGTQSTVVVSNNFARLIVPQNAPPVPSGGVAVIQEWAQMPQPLGKDVAAVFQARLPEQAVALPGKWGAFHFGLGKFFAGSDRSEQNFARTPDGIAWDVTTVPFLMAYGTMADNGSRLLVSGYDAVNKHALWSSDNGGDTFTMRWASQSSNIRFNNVVWTGTRFVATLSNGLVLGSTDGAAWVSFTMDQGGIATGVNDTIRVVTANSGTWFPWDANDWSAWGAEFSGYYQYVKAIAHNGALFCGLTVTGFPSALTSLSSADGLWQQGPPVNSFYGELLSGTNFPRHLSWTGQQFVALLPTYDPASVVQVVTSPDGMAWSKAVVATPDGSAFETRTGGNYSAGYSTTIYSAGHRYGNGVHLILGTDGRLLRSTDLANWSMGGIEDVSPEISISQDDIDQFNDSHDDLTVSFAWDPANPDYDNTDPFDGTGPGSIRVLARGGCGLASAPPTQFVITAATDVLTAPPLPFVSTAGVPERTSSIPAYATGAAQVNRAGLPFATEG